MGHYINYQDFPENVTKEEICAARGRLIENEGEREDGHLLSHDSGFTLHNVVCANYDEAVKKIAEYDSGWYDDHGVKYYDVASVKPTKQMLTLRERIGKLREQKGEYAEKHHINNLKAKYVTCPECGSRIANGRWHANTCPVCRTDMRASYIIEKLAWYDEKIKEAEKKYTELEKKQKNKAKVRWLVKIEFHV